MIIRPVFGSLLRTVGTLGTVGFVAAACDKEELPPASYHRDASKTPTNHPPEVDALWDKTIQEGEEIKRVIRTSDPDGDQFTLSIDNKPEGATFDLHTGRFTWQTNFYDAGNYPDITITARDFHGLETQDSFSITVENVNQAPVFRSTEEGYHVAEGEELSFVVRAHDPDRNALTFHASGELSDHFDPRERRFSWTPDFDSARDNAYSLYLFVSDGDLRDSHFIDVFVDSTNHYPPDIDPIDDQEIDENTELTFTIVASDRDSNSEDISFSAEDLPEGATLDAQTGEFLWTPHGRQVGEHTTSIIVSDGEFSSRETVLITVRNNDNDVDGDGFDADEECDDTNPLVRPLQELELNEINESTTVCPGLYRGVNIVVNADNVTLTGEGVTLDGVRSDLRRSAIAGFRLSSLHVEGFSIQNYRRGFYLEEVNGASIILDSIETSMTSFFFTNVRRAQVEQEELLSPIRLVDSNNNRFNIESLATEGDRTAIELTEESDDNILTFGSITSEAGTAIYLGENCNDTEINVGAIRTGDAVAITIGAGSSGTIINGGSITTDNVVAINANAHSDTIIAGGLETNGNIRFISVANGLIEDVTFLDGASVYVGGPRNQASQNNIIQRCIFRHGGIELASNLGSSDNIVQDNRFEGETIDMDPHYFGERIKIGGSRNEFLRNIVTGITNRVTVNSIVNLGGWENRFEDNVIELCGFVLQAYGNGNTMLRNRIQNNEGERTIVIEGQDNIIKRNEMTDNVGRRQGLTIEGSNNTVQFNDFRRNAPANGIDCHVNRCAGNVE